MLFRSAKIGVAGIYSCVGNFIFLALNLLGGFAILVINEIPLTIGIGQAVAGTVCIVIASLWEIPLCLWLSKKVGIFVAVILNAGLGSVLGIFTATTSLWIICPYQCRPPAFKKYGGWLLHRNAQDRQRIPTGANERSSV